MKQVYKTPKIKIVSLDPSQALLQACVVGGGYFGWSAAASSFCMKGNAPTSCDISVKGQAPTGSGGDSTMSQEAEAS